MKRSIAFAVLFTCAAACSSDSASDESVDGKCVLADNTTATSTVNNGCALLQRDLSACTSDRTAAGLGGAWLKFSCRVKLAVSGGTVQVTTDSRPDYRSNFFDKDSACHDDYTPSFPDPNAVEKQDLTMSVPLTPTDGERTMPGGPVGVAINGVVIFSNAAAPGDDIFTESKSFDRCQGHPNETATYHYHSEPYAISFDDAALVGVMRDGYFVYGRRDADGSLPTTLDADGGHTGTTPDSATAVYHYHVNRQTSANAGTKGETQWFLTKGTFHALPGDCTGCGNR